MKIPFFLFIIFFCLDASAQIDTVIFVDPSLDPAPKKDSIKPEFTYSHIDTANYLNLTLDFMQIHNMSTDLFPVERFIFVGWDQTKEKPGYHIIRGEITDLETGKSAFVEEGGLVSDELNELFKNGGGHKFLMDYEYLTPDGKRVSYKYKWLITNEKVEK